MRGDGFQRALERGGRVVAEEEPEPLVISTARLLVERLEPVEPFRGTSAGSHADLERDDFGRQSAPRFEIVQQLPEFVDRSGDGNRMIRVGGSAWQGGLETPARCGLPLRQPLPEESIELPDDAVAPRRE